MSYEVKGTVHKIFDTESKKNNFQVRNFVIKTEGQYPQLIQFQLTQDRCDLISQYNEGDQINVNFDLRGTEWNGRFITNLNAWRLGAVTPEPVAPPAGGNGDFPPLDQAPPPTQEPQNVQAEDFADDLPF